jgi:hypothetical protein
MPYKRREREVFGSEVSKVGIEKLYQRSVAKKLPWNCRSFSEKCSLGIGGGGTFGKHSGRGMTWARNIENKKSPHKLGKIYPRGDTRFVKNR